jgi:hypothetical protein
VERPWVVDGYGVADASESPRSRATNAAGREVAAWAAALDAWRVDPSKLVFSSPRRPRLAKASGAFSFLMTRPTLRGGGPANSGPANSTKSKNPSRRPRSDTLSGTPESRSRRAAHRGSGEVVARTKKCAPAVLCDSISGDALKTLNDLHVATMTQTMTRIVSEKAMRMIDLR